eukprot:gnl/TRDRNA2_/TRDRNA2_188151_c0_seq1.p2 gnl/TRDRNA2_/TRDRNA2_188151_c0~~gnl/TRDRNA2_/TRDRNA2_188151_c0_seq1.p2  ORF type:complete len:306 (-),score=42.51 gnl/TRDRNA2_/TRDRNA2_188151_c0_seq1:227-1144(-)
MGWCTPPWTWKYGRSSAKKAQGASTEPARSLEHVAAEHFDVEKVTSRMPTLLDTDGPTEGPKPKELVQTSEERRVRFGDGEQPEKEAAPRCDDGARPPLLLRASPATRADLPTAPTVGSTSSSQAELTNVFEQRGVGTSSGQPILKPSAGTLAWARWTGDGYWYRARVQAVGAETIEVAWLRPPTFNAEAAVPEAERLQYLVNTGGDDASFRHVNSAYVVPMTAPRPDPVIEDDMPFPTETTADESRHGHCCHCSDMDIPHLNVRGCCRAGAQAAPVWRGCAPHCRRVCSADSEAELQLGIFGCG